VAHSLGGDPGFVERRSERGGAAGRSQRGAERAAPKAEPEGRPRAVELIQVRSQPFKHAAAFWARDPDQQHAGGKLPRGDGNDAASDDPVEGSGGVGKDHRRRGDGAAGMGDRFDDDGGDGDGDGDGSSGYSRSIGVLVLAMPPAAWVERRRFGRVHVSGMMCGCDHRSWELWGGGHLDLHEDRPRLGESSRGAEQGLNGVGAGGGGGRRFRPAKRPAYDAPHGWSLPRVAQHHEPSEVTVDEAVGVPVCRHAGKKTQAVLVPGSGVAERAKAHAALGEGCGRYSETTGEQPGLGRLGGDAAW